MAQQLNQQLNQRRLRANPWIRELCEEVRVSPKQLIQPLFWVGGISRAEPVPGLTQVNRETRQSLIEQIERDLEKGVRKFLLFGVPSQKQTSNVGKDYRFDETSEVIQAVKAKFGKDLWLAVDVCLCSYTHHGQCGILNDSQDHVLNSETVDVLARAAGAYAQAGADCVAPSDMMDGRVLAIRNELSRVGCDQTVLMSYSAKFHSRYYGPFRAAADSAPKGSIGLKDRATYQISPGRYHDAYASSVRDLNEGADLLMVKPGLPYLDVLYRLSQSIPAPWMVYEVSGEYAGIELLAEKGLVNGPAAHVEAWIGFVRAGATGIITYGARFGREWIEGQN